MPIFIILLVWYKSTIVTIVDRQENNQPPIENIPALLIRTCKGPEREFHDSANLATESKDRRSSSITYKNKQKA